MIPSYSSIFNLGHRRVFRDEREYQEYLADCDRQAEPIRREIARIHEMFVEHRYIQAANGTLEHYDTVMSPQVRACLNELGSMLCAIYSNAHNPIIFQVTKPGRTRILPT